MSWGSFLTQHILTSVVTHIIWRWTFYFQLEVGNRMSFSPSFCSLVGLSSQPLLIRSQGKENWAWEESGCYLFSMQTWKEGNWFVPSGLSWLVTRKGLAWVKWYLFILNLKYWTLTKWNFIFRDCQSFPHFWNENSRVLASAEFEIIKEA